MTTNRIGRMITTLRRWMEKPEPRRRVDGNPVSAQRWGRIIASEAWPLEPARWFYQVEEVRWNQATSNWEFVGSIFGVTNLLEVNNQTVLHQNGNGTVTETRSVGGIQYSFWVGGSDNSGPHVFRLMPCSIGTPIVPLIEIGNSIYFELENALDKLQVSCQ